MVPASVPIFIITCDRLGVLRESIASYREHIRTPFEIVIHDNGSTYQPLLAYLEELEGSGVAVYRHAERIVAQEQLNGVAGTVARWFSGRAPGNYVVTDPDVALVGDCGDILELYAHLLETAVEIEVVGPMLRIDDLPDCYPLKAEVIERHMKQFWHKSPLELTWRGRRIGYQHARIDTTFGMYRAGFRFRRLCRGYRTYAPYWARHLDWYIDPQRLSGDQKHYLHHASRVTHWGGARMARSLPR